MSNWRPRSTPLPGGRSTGRGRLRKSGAISSVSSCSSYRRARSCARVRPASRRAAARRRASACSALGQQERQGCGSSGVAMLLPLLLQPYAAAYAGWAGCGQPRPSSLRVWTDSDMELPLPPLDVVRTRGRTSVAARLRRLQAKSWHIGQCAVAAALAWFVASDVLGHQTPFFAPDGGSGRAGHVVRATAAPGRRGGRRGRARRLHRATCSCCCSAAAGGRSASSS
jgi:hypothetical protein